MERKKVLIFTDCYLFGGSERLMASLVKNPDISDKYEFIYVYRKHKLYQTGLINEFGTDANDHFVGVKLISTDTISYLIKRLNIHKFFRQIACFILLLIRYCIPLELINFFKLRKLIKQYKPDIIHINSGGYPAARSCRLMVFAAYHANCQNLVFQVNNIATLPKLRLSKWIDSNINKRVKYFVTASIIAQKTLAKNRMFPIEKTVKIPNSVECSTIIKTRKELCVELNIPSDGFLICEVAFIEYRKGQQTLVKAMELLKKQRPDIYANTYLVFVGSGVDEEKICANVATLKMSDHIKLTGYKANFQDYMAACDLFALPSIADEDMPLVILSAMRMGKTIISTKFAGIKDAIEEGVSGILLEPNEHTLPEELFENIVKLYANKAPNTYGQEAKKRFDKHFSNKIYAERIVDLYKKAEV